MKRCPKCGLDYADDTLEFCLEDGTPLTFASKFETEVPTVTFSNKSNPATEKTVNLPFLGPAKTFDFTETNPPQTIPQAPIVNEKIVRQSNNALEIAPIVIALAHNWWQWIYLNNQYYSSFSSYVLSANFLMWLLLLTAGTIAGLFAIKRCQNKGFAFTSLVILSINLILFLVPKR